MGFVTKPAQVDGIRVTWILLVVDQLTMMAIYLPCQKISTHQS
jgi:hypothetical protein